MFKTMAHIKKTQQDFYGLSVSYIALLAVIKDAHYAVLSIPKYMVLDAHDCNFCYVTESHDNIEKH